MKINIRNTNKNQTETKTLQKVKMGRQESKSKNKSKSQNHESEMRINQKGLSMLEIKTMGVVYYLSINWLAQNKDQHSDSWCLHRLRFKYTGDLTD